MPSSVARIFIQIYSVLAFSSVVVLSIVTVSAQTPSSAKPAGNKGRVDVAPGTPAAGKSASPAIKTFLASADVAPDADPEELKERVTAERFLSVLEKNPRRGTALDRVYGFHVERGTLDKWVQQYRDRLAKQERDGPAWLLLGLIEAQRGQDAAAVTALQQADKYLPENALASYYLGQSLILTDQLDAAAAAFERSIERKPVPADQLEIFQALGRIYQRLQQDEKALEVWNRLEVLFPNDLRVQEQIAQALVDEDQLPLALQRFEGLAAKTSKDLNRQAQFRIRVAEIKARLGQTPESLADFEKLLGQLNPESWLYRDVRQKIDDIFLRNQDQAGLATYYSDWLDRHPDDVDAMVRLARLLAGLERTEESRNWLEKGLQLAPSRQDLRLAVIEQLVADKRFPEAIKHYELLDGQQPNNPDTIRDWGRLVLRDITRPEADRRSAAAEIWKRLIAAKPQDPVTISQVADLFRQSEMATDAIALYQAAIKLAPEASQYREYLGEYYHHLKKTDLALATWREIAAGKNRTPPHLARLAEVLMGFGYLAEGIESLSAAVTLEPKDLDLRMRFARALNRAEHYGESLQQLHFAEPLAMTAEDSEAILALQLQNYQAAEILPQEIKRLQIEVARSAAGPQRARKWFFLARLLEANREVNEAGRAVQQSLVDAPESIPVLVLQARLQDANRQINEAIVTYRKLAALDRRYRTEHLTNVARLEASLDHKSAALQAGRDIILAAPGNPESYEFFAQLCFQLDENDEGLNALRRSVRINSSDPQATLRLASALAERFRIPEAIELYWRAFDKSTDLDNKLDVVQRLTDLYLKTGHFDRVLEHFERLRPADGQQQRIVALCLAQAYQAAGDFGAARIELERLLNADSRDTQLLQQLVKLAEHDGDFQAAAKYQAQLTKVAPGPENEMQLVQLLTQMGDRQQVTELLVKNALADKNLEHRLKNLDGLLERKQYQEAAVVAQRLLRDEPQNWEYLYRQGIALFRDQRPQATPCFHQLLAFNFPDEAPGWFEQLRKKGASNESSILGSANGATPLVERFDALNSVRALMGEVAPGSSGRSAASPISWTPRNYGEARIAAIGWLLKASHEDSSTVSMNDSLRQRWEQVKTTSRCGTDWFYALELQGNRSASWEVAKSLVEAGLAPEDIQYMYLEGLFQRANPGPAAAGNVTVQSAPLSDMQDLKLSPAELNRLVACFSNVTQHPDSLTMSSSVRSPLLLNLVMAQLRYANRATEAERIFSDFVARLKSQQSVIALLDAAVASGEIDHALRLWDLYGQPSHLPQPSNVAPRETRDDPLIRLMTARAEAHALPDILRILDHCLTVSIQSNSSGGLSKSLGTSVLPAGKPPTRQTTFNALTGQSTVTIKPIIAGPLDRYSTILLRTANDLFQKAERSVDLIEHFEAAAANPVLAAEVRIRWQVGLAVLQFSNGSEDLALQKLTELAQQHPTDPYLRILLAQLHQIRGEFGLALDELEGVESPEQEELQVRDGLILQFAMQSEDHGRAQQAAARLAAASFDEPTRRQLAVYMQALGMLHEAAKLQPRGVRSPTTRVGSMIARLNESKTRGNPEAALQIAQTILQTVPAPQTLIRRPGYDEINEARKLATQVLAKSDQLQTLIERIEQQLQTSPNSIALNRTLAEYYAAAGKPDKVKEIGLKLVELDQSDPRARFNAGIQLLETQQVERGLALIRSAVKQQPDLAANRSNDVISELRKAKKIPEMAAFLAEIDLRSTSSSSLTVEALQQLATTQQIATYGPALLKQAWEAFPESRPHFVTTVYMKTLWKSPELYDYVRQVVIPTTEGRAEKPWSSFQITQRADEGEVSGNFNILLEIAESLDRISALDQEVAAALQASPHWQGGHALRAILQIRKGNHEVALKSLATLLDENQATMTPEAAWLIGQEVKSVPNAEQLALRYYEHALLDPSELAGELSLSPLFPAVYLQLALGRREQAREMLLRASPARNTSGETDGYVAANIVKNRFEIASRLQRLEFPVDSIRIYNLLIHDELTLSQAVGMGPQYLNAAQSNLQEAVKELTPARLASGIQALTRSISGRDEAGQGGAVDFLLALTGTTWQDLRITSPLTAVVDQVARSPALNVELASSLRLLGEQRPDDPSVQIIACLLALHTPDSTAQLQSVQQLDRWLDAHPLDAIPVGQRLSVAQHEAATAQLPLWLVAGKVLSREKLRAIGHKIAARAIEAARRQSSHMYQIAFLYEAGRLNVEAGDPATAETDWTELLDVLLPEKPAIDLQMARRPRRAAAAVPSGPNVSAVTIGARAYRIRPLNMVTGPGPDTFPHVDRGLEFAALAAAKDFHALSFEALRRALVHSRNSARVTGVAGAGKPRNPGSPNANQQNSQSVERIQRKFSDSIMGLHQTWTSHHAPADQIYASLLDIVVPAGQRDVVFLFPDAVAEYEATGTSIGMLLIRQAIIAGKIDDLRHTLQARVQSKNADFAARLLLSRLALETRDQATAKIELLELDKVAAQKQTQYPADALNEIALLVLADDDLALATQPLLLRAGRNLMELNRPGTAARSSQVYFRLSQLHFERGALPAGTQILDQYLTDQKACASADKLSASMLRGSLLKVAGALARVGQLEEAFARLGEATERTDMEADVDVPHGFDEEGVLQALQAKPAAERYQLLKAWTIDNLAKHNTVRTLDIFRSDHEYPPLFAGQAPTVAHAPFVDGSASTLLELVDAARECNALPELLADTQPLVNRKVANALELQVLIRIALQQSVEVAVDLQTLIEQTRALQKDPYPPTGPLWSRYHVACAALRDPGFRDAGQQLTQSLIGHAAGRSQNRMVRFLRYFLSSSFVQQIPEARQVGSVDPGLQWWRTSLEPTADEQSAGAPPAWWVAHAGLISAISGPHLQSLCLRYPLEGTFEFSADVYSSADACGLIGYSGLIFDLTGVPPQFEISPHGFSGKSSYALGIPYASDQFHRHTIRIQADEIRYLIDNAQIHSEPLSSHQSPWLTLSARGSHQAIFRNVQITGQPNIPRQVRLVEGNRLEGWISNFFGERQPPRTVPTKGPAAPSINRDRRPVARGNSKTRTIERPEPTAREPQINKLSSSGAEIVPIPGYDWQASGGIIHGRCLPGLPAPTQPQSWLYYHRPLETDETLAYEFLYEPGVTLVHPTLGRQALLLAPQGIQLHWMTTSDHDQQRELPFNNVVEQPADRRGPATLPLLPGQWNRLRVRLLESKFQLELNDQLVYESSLTSHQNRQFGFYHDRTQTAAQVRNVILTGHWPEQLPPQLLANPTAPRVDQTLSDADLQARHQLIGHSFYLLNVRDVLQQAASLGAPARYAYLSNWVLPSSDCPAFRMIGDFAAITQPPADEGSAEPVTPMASFDQHRGVRQLQSPAYELVAVAKSLGKLEELQQRIDKMTPVSTVDANARLALTTLISLADENGQSVEAQLAALQTAQQKSPVDATVDGRWPAVLVGWQAIQQPGRRPLGQGLLDLAESQSANFAREETWSIITRHLAEQARWVIARQPTATSIGSQRWIIADGATAEQRRSGIPASEWILQDGALRHLPGISETWLYYPVPLFGDFELTCEMSSGEGQELQIHYGARHVGLASNRQDVELGRVGGPMMASRLGQPVRGAGDPLQYQLTVEDGVISVFVNGEKIIDRRKAGKLDPWLAIRAPRNSTGWIRNIQITGNPQIPTAVELLENDRVDDAWRGDYFHLTGTPWHTNLIELQSPKVADARLPRPSWMRYHRPITEDAELTYEYYYQPGAADVSPTLGRLAFLLNPQGVDLHWLVDHPLSDGMRLSGTAGTAEQHNRRGPEKLPLIPQDWNVVRLTLIGNTITLYLNKVEIYQRLLEPVNQREFGLFHFADQTEVRVRHVDYRGKWPQVLPKPADLKLPPPTAR